MLKEVECWGQDGEADAPPLESPVMSEQADTLRRFVKRVTYNGRNGKLQIQFLPNEGDVAP